MHYQEMILSDVGKLMAKCCDKRDMCLIKNQGFQLCWYENNSFRTSSAMTSSIITNEEILDGR